MEIDPEYEKFYNNLGNRFAEIDRNAIDSISISIGDNFKRVFSEFSDVQNALKWIKDYLRNETYLRKTVGRKSLSQKSNKESIKIVIHNIIQTEFKDKVKKGETVSGWIRRKILDILSKRNRITITDGQLRSYLSRLEYSNQREHSSDKEFGFKSERNKKEN